MLCARLDVFAADRCTVGSSRKSRGSKGMIKSWFVPPIVIPMLLLALGMAAFVTRRAFH